MANLFLCVRQNVNAFKKQISKFLKVGKPFYDVYSLKNRDWANIKMFNITTKNSNHQYNNDVHKYKYEYSYRTNKQTILATIFRMCRMNKTLLLIQWFKI